MLTEGLVFLYLEHWSWKSQFYHWSWLWVSSSLTRLIRHQICSVLHNMYEYILKHLFHSVLIPFDLLVVHHIGCLNRWCFFLLFLASDFDPLEGVSNQGMTEFFISHSYSHIPEIVTQTRHQALLQWSYRWGYLPGSLKRDLKERSSFFLYNIKPKESVKAHWEIPEDS